MGRNTWLYTGLLQAGHRAAAVMSLLETAVWLAEIGAEAPT